MLQLVENQLFRGPKASPNVLVQIISETAITTTTPHEL